MEMEKNYRKDEVLEEEGLSLVDIFVYLRDNIILLFAIVIGFFLIGFAYTWYVVTPEYTATTGLMIQFEDASNLNELTLGERLVPTYRDILTWNETLESVLDANPQIQMSTGAFKRSISVTSVSLVMYISVRHEDPAIAQELVNDLADYIAFRVNSDTSDTLSSFGENVVRFDRAKLPGVPSAPNKMLNLVISVLLGGIVAVGAIFIKEMVSNKFKHASEVEKVLGLPVISEVNLFKVKGE